MPNMGPAIGLLIPVWDWTKPNPKTGEIGDYWYLSLEEFWALQQSAHFPAGVSTGAGDVPGEMVLKEPAAVGQDYVSVLAPPSLPATVRYQLPSTPPTEGQVLSASPPNEDGISVCSWK